MSPQQTKGAERSGPEDKTMGQATMACCSSESHSDEAICPADDMPGSGGDARTSIDGNNGTGSGEGTQKKANDAEGMNNTDQVEQKDDHSDGSKRGEDGKKSIANEKNMVRDFVTKNKEQLQKVIGQMEDIIKEHQNRNKKIHKLFVQMHDTAKKNSVVQTEYKNDYSNTIIHDKKQLVGVFAKEKNKEQLQKDIGQMPDIVEQHQNRNKKIHKLFVQMHDTSKKNSVVQTEYKNDYSNTIIHDKKQLVGVFAKEKNNILFQEYMKFQECMETNEKGREDYVDTAFSDEGEPTILQKAWDLVEGAIPLQTDDIQIIAQDDIVFLAERLLQTQKEFREKNIPYFVDIAYHHTKSENLGTIRTDGLLSRTERKERQIMSKSNGGAYGDGIYCSIDPIAHAYRYGDVTIMHVRMRGKESPYSSSKNINTRVVPRRRFCVLKSCNQCIPLFYFPSKLLRKKTHYDRMEILKKIADFHKKVQHNLLDKIFNGNVQTLFDPSQFPCRVKPQYIKRRPPPPQNYAVGPKYRPTQFEFRSVQWKQKASLPSSANSEADDLTNSLIKEACYICNGDTEFPMQNLLTIDTRSGCKSKSNQKIILHFEFRSWVRIHSMDITEFIGVHSDQHPRKILCYRNAGRDLGFKDLIHLKPTTTINLTRPHSVQLILKDFAKEHTQNITLFVEENFGGRVTSICNLKFYGHDYMKHA